MFVQVHISTLLTFILISSMLDNVQVNDGSVVLNIQAVVGSDVEGYVKVHDSL